MSATEVPLNGVRVLVLEDETLVSMMIEDMLDDLGCRVVGPFARLDDALGAVRDGKGIDLALLDVNVGGTRSFPLAEALQAADVPFVFTTGYDDAGMPGEWRERPSLRKPFMLRDVETALRKALQSD